MVFVSIRIVVLPKNHDEAMQILRSTAEWSRFKPGCLSSRIYEDVQEDNALMFEEIWRCEEDLECHLCSDAYRKVLLVLEMGRKEPEIRFGTISTTGIERIARARTCGK